MSIKIDESMARILWAVPITGFALSLPFAAYYVLHHGFSTVVLVILFVGAVGSYVIVGATGCLWGLCFLVGRIIKIVFDGILPQDGDETLTWPQSFKRAAVLLVVSIVFFAALFLLFSGGGWPIRTILEKQISERHLPAKAPVIAAPAVEAPATPAAPAVEADDVLAKGNTHREIADYLAKKAKFDIVGARAAGYTDEEIIEYLMTKDSLPTPKEGYEWVPVPQGEKQEIRKRFLLTHFQSV